jgi:hypothetical protein
MKRQVMQPFRAPRQQNAKSSPTRQSPRRQGKQDQEVQDVPYKKGIKRMSYREALKTSTYGEVWHQTPKIRCHVSYWWMCSNLPNEMY